MVSTSPACSAVLHRSLRETPPIVVSGGGCYLVDAAGRRYLDASGGAAVSCLGHSNARVIEAVRDQIGRLAFAHTSFFTNGPSETLARRLVDRAPAGFGEGRVAFVGSGSEAMEAALKFARQYFVEKGEPARHRFISRRMSYHGNTLGALAVGGHAGRRKMYQPLLAETTQISPCYAYRHRKPDETLEAYGLRAADELAAEIERVGAGEVAAFIAEPVVGATLGTVAAAPGYFKRIRQICDHYGILFIADEVMCGMGRCGTLFAMDAEGVCPDIITIAKGLGAGYAPIGATMVRQSLVDTVRKGSGLLSHGHTYMSHAVSCAASLAVMDAFEEDGLLARVVLMGEELEAALKARFANHSHVGDIRGRGLFWSLELVADRASKAPFPASFGLAAALKRRAQDNGLICYPAPGTADGTQGDHVLLAPPFIITSEQIGELVDKLSDALETTLSARKAA